MGEKTKLQEMLEKKEKIRQGGGEKKVAKQHGAGKLTARERIDLLFDPGTFQEYNIFMKHRCHDFGMEKVDTPAEGVVTGYGLIHGRGAFAFAHDFTVLGGAMGEMQGMKVKRIQELAMDAGVPLIGLNDSGGGRIQEGPATSYGAIFWGDPPDLSHHGALRRRDRVFPRADRLHFFRGQDQPLLYHRTAGHQERDRGGGGCGEAGRSADP